MPGFETPTDLMNNRGLIADPEAFAREKHAASWLYLCGEEFASVFARAEADGAAFVQSGELRAWIADGLEQLS
jgi:hypothetical protein